MEARTDIIRKVGAKWILLSKDGKRKLGEFATKAAAKKRERQIQRIKHAKRADSPEDKRRTVGEVKFARMAGIARRPRKRLPQQSSTKAIERDYAKEILKIVDLAREVYSPTIEELEPLIQAARSERIDVGESDQARQRLEAAAARLERSISRQDLEDIAQRFATRTATFQRVQLNKQVRAALGADIFINDRRLRAFLDGFVSENVALIQDITRKLASEVELLVTRGIQSGITHTELTKQFQEKLGFTRNRAKLIATDQIGKLYGQVNAARQQELGVDAFIWRTASDERVRPAHQALNGRQFTYGNPPSEGLPGTPIRCRCYAEPVFDAILGEVDDDEG